MASRAWSVHVLAILLAVSLGCEGAVYSGWVDTGSDWQFLGKFCYNYGEGQLSINASSWGSNTTSIDVYADWPNSNEWDFVQSLNCTQRRRYAFWSVNGTKSSLTTPYGNIARHVVLNNRTWVAGLASMPGRCGVVSPSDLASLVLCLDCCPDVAASNCGGGHMDMIYDIVFLNPGNPVWDAPFSTDEQGLMAMYLTFVIVSVFGIAVEIIGLHRLCRAKSLHPIVILLAVVIFVEFFSFFLYLEHYAAYSSNGSGHPTVKLFAELLDMTALTIFTLLLLLIAKGWGVSDNALSHQRILLAVAILLAITYAGLFIWQQSVLNPASTTFYYDTWPGWVLAGTRVVLLLGFLWSVWRQWREENHPNKRKFYVTLAIFGSLWLLSLPFVVFFAYGIPSWYREKVVLAIYNPVNTFAIAVLAFLLWPSRAAEYFKIAPPEIFEGKNSRTGSSNQYEEL